MKSNILKLQGIKVKSSEGPGETGSWTFLDTGEINDYLGNLTKMMKRIKELFYTSSN